MATRYIRFLLFIISTLITLSNLSLAGEWIYRGDVLPSSAGFAAYGSNSNENGNGITSSVISDLGVTSLKVTDASLSYRCAERNLELGNVSFDTGITLAARVRCLNTSGSSYNLGISNGNVGGMYLSIKTDRVELVQLDGTVRGASLADNTSYHTYYITVLNSSQGDNSSAVWRVYRDGTETFNWTGAGQFEMYDGFFLGHTGAGGTGAWYFDWVAARNDGAFGPDQWNPAQPPAAPTVTLPANGTTIATPTTVIQWTGESHDMYEVHLCTSNSPDIANGWDSGQVANTTNACTTGTLSNGTYYVFVRLRNANGWGEWSSAGRSFSVNVTVSLPQAPVISIPENGTILSVNKPAIQWIGDEHYQYEVHVNTTGQPAEANIWDSGMVSSSDDSCDTAALANGNYHAFIRIRNSAGWGPWSTPGCSFTISDSGKRMKKGWVLIRNDINDALELLSHIDEYHVNHVQLSHELMMYVWQPIDYIDKRQVLNQLIDAAHAKGTPEDPVEVVLWVHETDLTGVPSYCFSGGKLNYDNPAYWDWLKFRYRQLFSSNVCPKADGLVLTFSENFYGIDPWNRTKSKHDGKTPEQTMSKIIETIWGVCQEFNPIKSLYVRTWNGGGGPDTWMRNAVLDNDSRIWMMSKATGAGDWWVIRDDYDIIGTAVGHPELIEFDVVGEYWGLTNTPWAGIDYLKHLWSEFSVPRGADGLAARVDRDSGRAIQSPGRINMYALDVLADNPGVSTNTIYDYWCSHWFGKAAGPRVASSLRRTFDITNACYGLPTPMWNSGSREAFSTDIARDYCLRSLFDIDYVNAALKSSANFLSDGSQTNYQVLRDPLVRAANMLGLPVPQTLFGDFSPSYSMQTDPTCEIYVVDAQYGLNPNSIRVEYSADGGVNWLNYNDFTVSSTGGLTSPYHITAYSVQFGALSAARNKIRFVATNQAGTVTTSRTYTVRGLETADINLGTMAADGLEHPQGSDGDTLAVSAGGRICRRLASSNEASFYFKVDDGFAYDRSAQNMYLQVDYYGTSGSITPTYDSTETYEQALAPVYLNGTSIWQTATWRLDNINFGNRTSSSGADFRLNVAGNTGVYISRVQLSYSLPVGTLSQPTGLSLATISPTQVELTWNAVPNAAGYRIYRGDVCAGSSLGTYFVDTNAQANTQYTYRVVAFNSTSYTSCASDYNVITTLSIPPSPLTVTCGIPTATWQTNNTFTFNAVGGFGANKVASYKYAWDESPTHVWTGNEPDWPSIVDPPSGTGWSVWYPNISPTANDSGWLLYEGSTTMRGTFESMVNENGVRGWMYSDQSNFWSTKVKLAAWPNVPISRDNGATLVVRMKAADSPTGWVGSSWNFGFNLLDCPEIGAIVRPNWVQIVGPSASGPGKSVDNGLLYHTYTMTLGNAVLGSNSTTKFILYRDGEKVDEVTHGTTSGTEWQWSGPLLGQPSSNGRGAWCIQWVAWKTGVESTPGLPTPSISMTAPAQGSSGLYLHLQGFNADGVPNGMLDLGPYYYWNGSDPIPPKVTDDGMYTTRDAVHVKWSTSGPSIDRYEIAVGTTAGGQNVLSFTPVGTQQECTRKGLTMAEGSTYFVTVRGVASGRTGLGGSTDGIIVATDIVHTGVAKTLPDGAPVALYNQAVTAVFGGCAYVQEPFGAGIRVVSARPINAGDTIELAGVMAGSGGERTISADTIVVVEDGPDAKPIAMSNKALGGRPVPPYIPEFVPVSSGPNNLSLLSRTWGIVGNVDTQTGSFTLDDGSGAPVKCLLPAGVSIPQSGRFAVVTGIVSCEKPDNKLRRILLVRRAEDLNVF